jgi:hypothetical protein
MWELRIARPIPRLLFKCMSNDQTFILRENLCSTFEAPFMYRMIGESRALLIDTGDVAEAQQVALAVELFRSIRSGLTLTTRVRGNTLFAT